MDYLSKVLERLQEYGLKANIEKCSNIEKCLFLKNQVRYLGHIIDAKGLHKTNEKVKAIIMHHHQQMFRNYDHFLGFDSTITSFCQTLQLYCSPYISFCVLDRSGNGPKCMRLLSRG